MTHYIMYEENTQRKIKIHINVPIYARPIFSVVRGYRKLAANIHAIYVNDQLQAWNIVTGEREILSGEFEISNLYLEEKKDD